MCLYWSIYFHAAIHFSLPTFHWGTIGKPELFPFINEEIEVPEDKLIFIEEDKVAALNQEPMSPDPYLLFLHLSEHGCELSDVDDEET